MIKLLYRIVPIYRRLFRVGTFYQNNPDSEWSCFELNNYRNPFRLIFQNCLNINLQSARFSLSSVKSVRTTAATSTTWSFLRSASFWLSPSPSSWDANLCLMVRSARSPDCIFMSTKSTAPSTGNATTAAPITWLVKRITCTTTRTSGATSRRRFEAVLKRTWSEYIFVCTKVATGLLQQSP